MTNKRNDELRYHMHGPEDDSWWEYDARGIPLAKVCEECVKVKLAGFRPEVLTDSNYEANEEIEPDDWASERNQDREFSEYLERRAERYGRG
jgi:hypothetical protein